MAVGRDAVLHRTDLSGEVEAVGRDSSSMQQYPQGRQRIRLSEDELAQRLVGMLEEIVDSVPTASAASNPPNSRLGRPGASAGGGPLAPRTSPSHTRRIVASIPSMTAPSLRRGRSLAA